MGGVNIFDLVFAGVGKTSSKPAEKNLLRKVFLEK